jgi:hypothetical protein
MHLLMVLLKRVAVRIIDAFAEKPDPIAIVLQMTGIEQRSDMGKNIWRRREVSEHQTLIYLLLLKEI